MSYDKKSVLHNKPPYRVIKNISSKDGNYGAEISRETGIKQPLVSEIISHLTDNELLLKGKRTRTQNYKLNYEGCRDYLLNHIEEETGKTIYELNQEGLFVVEELEEKVNSKLPKLYESYIEGYCKIKNQSTIHAMLVTDFFEDLNFVGDLPDWLELLHEIGEEELNHISTTQTMYNAVNNLNE